MKKCKLCGGILAFLGALGRMEYFRCLNCGMELRENTGRMGRIKYE